MSEHPIKPYYMKELANLYDVSVHTMRTWINKIPDLGEKVGYRWTVIQVQKIFHHLGPPRKEEKEQGR